MATNRRQKGNKIAHLVYGFCTLMQKSSLFAIAIGLLVGMLIGSITTPAVQKTVTRTVDVPVYDSKSLPVSEDVNFYDVPLSHGLQRYIYEVCADEEVPVSLVMAMVEKGSNFDPEVVSSTDDYGLMQINEINHDTLAKKYRSADMLDPYQNIFCGTKIIGSYIKAYDGDYNKALMAYSMGKYGAEKAWRNGIDFSSYSEEVINLMTEYERKTDDK